MALVKHLKNLLGNDPNIKTLIDANVCTMQDVFETVGFGTLNIVAEHSVDVVRVLTALIPSDMPKYIGAHATELNRPIRISHRKIQTCRHSTTKAHDFSDFGWSTSEWKFCVCGSENHYGLNLDVVLLPHIRHNVPSGFGAKSAREINHLAMEYCIKRDAFTMFVLNDDLPDWNYHPIIDFFANITIPVRGALFSPELRAFKRTKKVSLPLGVGALVPEAKNFDIKWEPMSDFLATMSKTSISIPKLRWDQVSPAENARDFYEHLRHSVSSDKAATDALFAKHRDEFLTLAAATEMEDASSNSLRQLCNRQVMHGIWMGIAQCTVLRQASNADVQKAIQSLTKKPEETKTDCTMVLSKRDNPHDDKNIDVSKMPNEPSVPVANLACGDLCIARDKIGVWYVARVCAVEKDEGDTAFLLHFIGYSCQHDELISEHAVLPYDAIAPRISSGRGIRIDKHIFAWLT